MATDKYKEFMNYLHNELGITKSDIEKWTKEAVYDVADRYIEHNFSERSLEQRIMSMMRSRSYNIWRQDSDVLSEDIKQKIAHELASQMTVKAEIIKKK